MDRIIWAAFRNLDLFSVTLELLITGAVWKQLIFPPPFFPPAPSSCCCSNFLLGSGDRSNVGVWQGGENWAVVQHPLALLCGECRYVFWKTAGFDLQKIEALPENCLKGKSEGSQQQNCLLASKVFLSKASLNPWSIKAVKTNKEKNGMKLFSPK